MKKGQGISINMLILIVLGVIVLLIAVALVVSKSKAGDGEIKKGTECGFAGDGATCVGKDPNTKGCSNTQSLGIGFCPGEQICCKAN